MCHNLSIPTMYFAMLSGIPMYKGEKMCIYLLRALELLCFPSNPRTFAALHTKGKIPN